MLNTERLRMVAKNSNAKTRVNWPPQQAIQVLDLLDLRTKEILTISNILAERERTLDTLRSRLDLENNILTAALEWYRWEQNTESKIEDHKKIVGKLRKLLGEYDTLKADEPQIWE